MTFIILLPLIFHDISVTKRITFDTSNSESVESKVWVSIFAILEYYSQNKEYKGVGSLHLTALKKERKE